LIVGGIIPAVDAERLKAAGVAAVYTPKDFEINAILGAIVKEVEARFDAGAPPSREDRARA
jgi:ethylmalonyl-CoA mutase